MNKECLMLSDRAYIIRCKESKSEIFLNNDKNLIENKTIFQSDNFSYTNEKILQLPAEKISAFNQINLNDANNFSNITEVNIKHLNEINFNTSCLDNYGDSYKIISPINNDSYQLGEEIYFECALVTNNPLSKENFNDLIWVSSLDGFIGINNKFKSMLSVGEHFISLVAFQEIDGKNNEINKIKIIKDEIKVVIINKPVSSTEI